jgi:hypothetical protein
MQQGIFVLHNTYYKGWCKSFISSGPTILWDKVGDNQEQRRSLDKGSKSVVQNHQNQGES